MAKVKRLKLKSSVVNIFKIIGIILILCLLLVFYVFYRNSDHVKGKEYLIDSYMEALYKECARFSFNRLKINKDF